MLSNTGNSAAANPTATDTEALRLYYEDLLRTNPNHVQAVYYLAVWHLERQSYQQARRFFAHLSTLRADDVDVWLSLSVCGAFSEEYEESHAALNSAKKLCKTQEADIRWKFCRALLAEKRREFNIAMEGYTSCLNQSNSFYNFSTVDSSNKAAVEADRAQKVTFLKEVRGEVLLRIAILKKEMGQIDQAMQMCNSINSEPFNDTIKANALCLKGLLHEIRSEFPASEVVYRSVLQLKNGHATALERLGRVYLRYRETIPAAVQCFFKAVDTNPANHVAWYLLGRCYMATSQYNDACEAYNRAINLNPNDPQIWCSLGVLYYAFGQYREALGMLSRALKLDPTLSDAWYNVGALYDMCDQSEDAQQAYAKAKEHGLADRFSKAGLGMAASGTQSMNPPTAAPLLSHQDSSYGAGGRTSDNYRMMPSYSLNSLPSQPSSHNATNNAFASTSSSTLLSHLHSNTLSTFHPNSTSPPTVPYNGHHQSGHTLPSSAMNNHSSPPQQSYHSSYLSQSHLTSQPQASSLRSEYNGNRPGSSLNSNLQTHHTSPTNASSYPFYQQSPTIGLSHLQSANHLSHHSSSPPPPTA